MIVSATHHVSMAPLFRGSSPPRYMILIFRQWISTSHVRFTSTSFKGAGPPPQTYQNALTLLETLQSNRSIVSDISLKSSPIDMNQFAIPEMLEWTRKAGYEASDFAKKGLKCVHVAGTKGKGSTCLMVENILLQYRKQRIGDEQRGSGGHMIGKIGLYTSPHLTTVRERIRIDGVPISESMFARYFFDLWSRFSAAAFRDSRPSPDSPATKPGYFRFLTILAFHVFVSEGVESAIVECGIGGEFDSTNVLPAEAVTVSAITSLGIDHVGMLGNTLEEIAWHKAGIMKTGVPAFTVVQDDGAQTVLAKRAKEKGIELCVVPKHTALKSRDIRLAMDGESQKDNASLAITIAAAHLKAIGVEISLDQSTTRLPIEVLTGIETATAMGRWQILKPNDSNITWLLDGAHTESSIRATAYWYLSYLIEMFTSGSPPTATMLIFNQEEISSRDAKTLLRGLFRALLQANDDRINSFREQERSKGKNSQDHETYGQERTLLRNTLLDMSRRRRFTYAAFPTNEVIPGMLDPSFLTSRSTLKTTTEFTNEWETEHLKTQKELARLYETLDRNTLHMTYSSISEAVALAKRVSRDEGDRLLVLVTGSLKLVGGVLKVLELYEEKDEEEDEEEEDAGENNTVEDLRKAAGSDIEKEDSQPRG